MRKFPALRFLIRYGDAAAMAICVCVLTGILLSCWPSMGWMSVPVAVGGAAVAGLLAKSYAELVVMITEMVVPT
jgi:hypothetical protein